MKGVEMLRTIPVIFAVMMIVTDCFALPPAEKKKLHEPKSSDTSTPANKAKRKHHHGGGEQMGAMAERRITNAIEKKYDYDGDGFLDDDELKDMLKAKYNEVMMHGSAKVDSQYENKYDMDGEGIITKEGAALMKRDLDL